jgi:hypothetical protein
MYQKVKAIYNLEPREKLGWQEGPTTQYKERRLNESKKFVSFIYLMYGSFHHLRYIF